MAYRRSVTTGRILAAVAIFAAGTAIAEDLATLDLAAPPSRLAESRMMEVERILFMQRDPSHGHLSSMAAEEDALPVLDLLRARGFLPDVVDSVFVDALLTSVIDRAERESLDLAAGFDRPAPFLADQRIIAATETAYQASYPGYHAAVYTAVADLLTHLSPQCKDAYSALAGGIAVRREMGGLNYASDSFAGIALGGQISGAFLANGASSPAVEKGRSEMAAFTEAHGCQKDASDE